METYEIYQEIQRLIKNPLKISMTQLNRIDILEDSTTFKNLLIELKNIKFLRIISITASKSESNQILYHLSRANVILTIHVNLTENLSINSIIDIFPSAILYEREIYGIYHINFVDHPDLKPLYSEGV